MSVQGSGPSEAPVRPSGCCRSSSGPVGSSSSFGFKRIAGCHFVSFDVVKTCRLSRWIRVELNFLLTGNRPRHAPTGPAPSSSPLSELYSHPNSVKKDEEKMERGKSRGEKMEIRPWTSSHAHEVRSRSSGMETPSSRRR
ncbi:hypothetical protein EYF80_048818 [Liparis tanakae]|uniref:Uncharacterized protein n=1 Tax=Liparis tanakae TaxID=230148 RepID=A0A4Z2FJQ6_9TELE|nr:hypothetical protein EYF80_048818 [Liparis tanakae]